MRLGGEAVVMLKERRLTGRVQRVWKERAHDHLPSWSDIRNADFGPDWDFCFAIDLGLSDNFPYFIFMGDGLSPLAMTFLPDRVHWETTPMDLAAAKMDEAALSRMPVHHGDLLLLPNKKSVLFRCVLLPLSENGNDVTHIFGAATGRTA